MKKGTFILVFFLLISQVGKAQLMEIGIKAGANYSNLVNSNLQTEAITNYHAGVVVNLRISEIFSLQPELIYSTQGASYKEVVDEFKAKLGYISLPVMSKFRMGKVLSLELGPQFSWLATKKVGFATDVRELDFGVGGGLEVKLTNSIFIQGRYIVGLTEISKSADAKNSVGQLSVGFLF